MNEQEKIIKACANILVDTVLDVLYKDSHGWSNRPCETCRFITNIIGKPFGCYRYQQEKANRKD